MSYVVKRSTRLFFMAATVAHGDRESLPFVNPLYVCELYISIDAILLIPFLTVYSW
jgi:hypothetical protein